MPAAPALYAHGGLLTGSLTGATSGFGLRGGEPGLVTQNSASWVAEMRWQAVNHHGTVRSQKASGLLPNPVV